MGDSDGIPKVCINHTHGTYQNYCHSLWARHNFSFSLYTCKVCLLKKIMQYLVVACSNKATCIYVCYIRTFRMPNTCFGYTWHLSSTAKQPGLPSSLPERTRQQGTTAMHMMCSSICTQVGRENVYSFSSRVTELGRIVGIHQLYWSCICVIGSH